MTIEEVLQLIRAKSQDLNPVQELVLRRVWEGQTYSNMASESHYGEHYLRNTASTLWKSLSIFFNQPITKTNFRETLESRSLTREERALLDRSIRSEFPSQGRSLHLEFPSGPVPLGSPLYVERPPIEELTYQELTKPGGTIRIKAARKMGKSSLMLRILDRAAALNYRVVTLDFQQADIAVFATLDKCLRWFCANISRQVQLESRLGEFWDEEMGSKVSCTLYLQEYVLEKMRSPLVIALNEVNIMFEYPEIARDFLPMLRSWHEQAKQGDNLQQLRLIVIHSTEVYIPLNLNQSPFNVGLPIQLPYFTTEQVISLAQRYGLDWQDDTEAERLMETIGGHPYLVQLAFYHLCRDNITLDRLLQDAPTQAGIYSNYLRTIWGILKDNPGLSAAFQQVMNSDRSVYLEPILAYKLESLGLIYVHGNECTPTCKLYSLYFGSFNRD